MRQLLPSPLSRPLALYSPCEKLILSASLLCPGVPAQLSSAASTRTVGRAIFLGSLHCLPANVSDSSEEVEGKGASFPSSAGGHGCPGAGWDYM